jgi:hypothetical protein
MILNKYSKITYLGGFWFWGYFIPVAIVRTRQNASLTQVSDYQIIIYKNIHILLILLNGKSPKQPIKISPNLTQTNKIVQCS